MLHVTHTKPRRSRWSLLWYPVMGVVGVDLIYQVLISWRQANIIATAQPGLLILAILNQLAIYVVLMPVMQQFYSSAKIHFSGKRAFSLLTMGLAFARVIPFGDYIVWRSSLSRKRGGVSATTQWYVMYYTWMLSALVLLFLIGEALTYAFNSEAHVQALFAYLRFLPVSLSVIFIIALLATRFRWVREKFNQLIFDKLGSQSLSPLGIIRDRQLSANVLGLFTFAAVAAWIMESDTLYLCLRSIGVSVPLTMMLFGFTFARLFSLIPITPGGIGQIEAGSTLFFVAYGYPFGPILTATVLYRLISYWPALIIGGVTYFITGKTESAFELSVKKPVFASQLHLRQTRARGL